MLNRPASTFDPAAGLLRTEHFQMAYATNDIDQARARFQERYGIREFRSLNGELRQGGRIHVEFAWVGTLMYELIYAEGPGSDIYMDRLPAGDGFKLKHHHLGFLIHDEAEWQALMAEVESKQWQMPHLSHTPGFMLSCFVDAPELGHYLEYLFPEPAALEFFASVPGN